MPTTISGLLVFVLFLTPGLVSYMQRRALVPQRTQSPLHELAALVAVSTVTNVLALGVLFLLRLALPAHTERTESAA